MLSKSLRLCAPGARRGNFVVAVDGGICWIGLKSEKRMTWILGTSSILENRVELVTVSC